MAIAARRVHSQLMTVSERIQQQSFAYDEEFPPDVAEGLLLKTACRKAPEHAAPLKRAYRSCTHAARSVLKKR